MSVCCFFYFVKFNANFVSTRTAGQYPVSVETESTMGSCPLCNFHFCLLCRATYHGVEPCKLTSGDRLKLFQAYTDGSQSEKEELERRYGKKQMLTLVDDTLAATWLDDNSKKCPHCKTPIEVCTPLILQLLVHLSSIDFFTFNFAEEGWLQQNVLYAV